jgi:hypothetical protein
MILNLIEPLLELKLFPGDHLTKHPTKRSGCL